MLVALILAQLTIDPNINYSNEWARGVGNEWSDCVFARAKTMVRLPGPPDDIVTATFGGCLREEQSYRDALTQHDMQEGFKTADIQNRSELRDSLNS